MKLKRGANLQGLHISMRRALSSADKVWRSHNKELVVTAGLDGTHSAGSLHYYGRAVDLRSRYFRHHEALLVADELAVRVGNDYDVVLHASHIHIEYDPKEAT